MLTPADCGCQDGDGGSRKGSKGNAVRARLHNAAAAPATVSGEPPTVRATGRLSRSREGGRRRRPASQETCHRRSHARAQQAGCPDGARPSAPNRGAVTGKRRQFAVTGCCRGCVVSIPRDADRSGPGVALTPSHDLAGPSQASIRSSSTPPPSIPPTMSRESFRLSVRRFRISAICSMSAPAAASSERRCARPSVGGLRSSPHRTCALGFRA
jgi:hypothetical protein